MNATASRPDVAAPKVNRHRFIADVAIPAYDGGGLARIYGNDRARVQANVDLLLGSYPDGHAVLHCIEDFGA